MQRDTDLSLCATNILRVVIGAASQNQTTRAHRLLRVLAPIGAFFVVAIYLFIPLVVLFLHFVEVWLMALVGAALCLSLIELCIVVTLVRIDNVSTANVSTAKVSSQSSPSLSVYSALQDADTLVAVVTVPRLKLPPNNKR